MLTGSAHPHNEQGTNSSEMKPPDAIDWEIPQQMFSLRPDPTLWGQMLPDPCQALPAVCKAVLKGHRGLQTLSLPLANGQQQKYL